MADIKFSGRINITIEGKTGKGLAFLEDNMLEIITLTDGRLIVVVHREFKDELEVYFKENGLEVEIE